MRKAVPIIALLLLSQHPYIAAQSDGGEMLVSSVAIPHSTGDIELDGMLRDWSGIAPIEVNTEKLVRGASWRGVEDLSFRVWLTWDSRALLFAADIRDDDYQGCPTGRQIWNSDSFLLALRFPSSPAPEETFYIVATTSEGRPKGVGLCGRGSNFVVKNLPSLQLAVRMRDGFGPLFEGGIEWSDLLGTDAQPPERLELNLEVRDVDEGGRIKSMSWVKGPVEDGAPSFGIAVLLRPSELDGMIRERNDSFVEFVQLVILPVVVTDDDNDYVLDLEIEDFIVLEEGAEQKVESLRYETRPITVGLLIDCSGSMQFQIGEAKRAAKSFLGTLRSEDRCFVIAFNHNIDIIKDLEGDTDEAIEAIDKIEAEGGTLLYSTLNFALSRMRFLEEKKVIVLLSDGKDESQGVISPMGNEIGFQDVVERAKRDGASVYSVAFRLSDSAALSELQYLGRETGGKVFTAFGADQLLQAYGDIAEDLKSQYLITYVSNNTTWDGRWRSIDVKVKNRNFTIRTRPGYYAPQR